MGLISHVRRRFSQDWLFWLCAATVIILVPLLMAVAWRASIVEHARAEAVQAAISQSFTRRADIEGVALTLKDAESSHRGYVLSGEPSFLRRNQAAAAVIGGQIDRLAKVYAAEPKQLARVKDLRRTAAAKFANMARVRVMRDQEGLDAAAAAIAAGRGERLMEQARALTEEMSAVEARTLKRRLSEARRGTSDVRRLTNLSFTLVLLAIATASVMAFRYTRLRTQLIVRAQDQAQRRKAMFDAAMDAIVTFNPSGSIENINRAGEQMFGYRRQDLVGRDFSILAGRPINDEMLFLDRMRAAHLLQGGQSRELMARRADGTVFPVDLNLGEMSLPDGVHIVAVIRDVTERKRADVAKAEFISTVSHELRTPLTSIAGSLGLLTGGSAGVLPERAARLVTIAENNSRRLVRLINDILDIEKIDSGKLAMAMAPLDLVDLTRRTIDGIAGLAAELGVEINLAAPSAPLIVRGDGDRLTQVVTNLLSNAAKFSPRGGRVWVEIMAGDGVVRLAVRDEGPGVPAEFRDRIFSRFAQADSSNTRQKGGTGLGLAITKEIVDRHGGRIWFEPSGGPGAIFYVELPSGPAEEFVAAGPRLLLCEDDADAARVLGEALSLQGFSLDIVHTLADARTQLTRPPPYEALLLDLHLPDGHGIELLQALRADPATRSLPVIVVSGDPTDSAAAGALGLVDWLQKPLDMDRLQSALRQVTEDGDQPLVMHVDDDPDLRHLVVEAFAGRCRLIAADSVRSARDLLASVTPDLVILDVGLPDGSGLELLPELLDRTGRPLPVVVFSAQGLENPVIAKAVDAVLVKSRTSLGQLIGVVRKLSKNRAGEPIA